MRWVLTAALCVGLTGTAHAQQTVAGLEAAVEARAYGAAMGHAHYETAVIRRGGWVLSLGIAAPPDALATLRGGARSPPNIRFWLHRTF